MTYMSRNPQVASVVLDDITTTTPSNPPSGKVKVVDRNGTLFVRNSSGAESAIGTNSSVGSGEKNYVENPSAAASISGWTAAGNLEVVRTATEGDLPRENTTRTGIKVTSKSPVASGSSDRVYYDVNLDSVDISGRVMKLKWDQKVTGTYTAGQLEVVITTQADRATAVATPFTSAIPASNGTFQTYFIAPSTETCSVVIRATSSMTASGGIVISDVVVGPNVQVQGAAIGAWKSYTPTGGFTNTTYTGFYREIGDSIEVYVKGVLTGTPASSRLYVNLPTGYTPNTSGMTSAACLGSVYALDSGNNYRAGSTFLNTATTPNSIGCVSDAGGDYWNQATPMTWAVNDHFSIQATVPVDELSSNVTLANRAVEEYASNSSTNDGDDTSTFAYGPSGSSFVAYSTGGSKTVRFLTSIQSTDKIDFEIQDQTIANAPWITLVSRFGTSDGLYIQSSARQNTTYYGCGQVVQVSSTDVKVGFAQYATMSGATFGAAGSAWTGANTKLKWRLRKTSGGASVGYPISSANIVGRTDGVAPASGMVGHIAGAGTISAVTDTYGGGTATMATITLNKGFYLLMASGNVGSDTRPTSPTGINGAQVDIYDGSTSIAAQSRLLWVYGASNDLDFLYGSYSLVVPVNVASDSTTYTLRLAATQISGDASGSVVTSFAENQKFWAVRLA